MTYFYMKGVSGLFTNCPKCGNTIEGGEDIMIPIDFQDSQTSIMYPAICISCYRAESGIPESEIDKAIAKVNDTLDYIMQRVVK